MKRSILVLTLLAGYSMSGFAGIIYDVNRSWTDGFQTASLIGTVNVDLGNYSIQNMGPHPFNAVNLTMTVGATSYVVNNVLTDSIFGTGVFDIQATSTELIFSAAGNGTNPADLAFSESDSIGNRYAIGSNGAPTFEVAHFGPDSFIANEGIQFPLVWAVASSVPEPGVLYLLGVALAGLGLSRRNNA